MRSAVGRSLSPWTRRVRRPWAKTCKFSVAAMFWKIVLSSFFLLAPVPRGAAAGENGWARYNPTLNRTEYFDDRGRLTGFSRYNPVFNRTEYFDREQREVGWSRPSPFADRVEYYRRGLRRRVE